MPDSGVPSPGAPDAADAPDAPVSHDVLPVSGSQVRAVGWAAGGTLFAFNEYQDVKHDIACSLQVAEDGKSRCLPSFGSGVLFLDPACEHPVEQVYSGPCNLSDVPKYDTYQTQLADQCGTATHVVSIGKAIPTPAALYQRQVSPGSPAECRSYDVAPDGDFRETTPIPPSEWVSYQRKVVPLSAELGVEAWEGEDGSRIVGGFELLRENIACSAFANDGRTIGTNVSYCLPNARARDAVDYFTSSSCSTFVVSGNRCDPPVISERPSNTSCGSSEFFDLGKERTPGSLFWQVPGILQGLSRAESPCDPIAADWLQGEHARYFEIGPKIDPSRYPSLSVTWSGAGPVLGARWTTSAGGSTIPSSSSGTDRRTGEECAIFSDSRMNFCGRSLGSSYYPDIYGSGSTVPIFGDASCTKPLFSFSPSAPDVCSHGDQKPTWALPAITGCAAMSEISPIRLILGPHQGNIFRGGPRACVPLTAAELARGYDTIYDLGDPVDPRTVFPEVTLLEY